MLTKEQQQELFSTAIGRLIDQGKGAISEGSGTCTYYDVETNTSCAIGILMPLEIRKSLVNNPINTLLSYGYVTELNGIPVDIYDTDFLTGLQSVHDSSAITHTGRPTDNFVTLLKGHARRFAVQHQLSPVIRKGEML